MLSNIVGICSGHDNPDLWFSTDLNVGRPSLKKTKEETKIMDTLEAIKICSHCPVSQECLEQGMKPENLEYGVWGGTLPGERMLAAGVTRGSSFRLAIHFLNKVKLLQSTHAEE